MSRIEKLFQKIKNNPKNVQYSELRTLIEYHGYDLRSSGSGSHRWFRRKGFPNIHFPVHRPLGIKYVKDAIKILEEYCEIDLQ